MFMRLAVSLGVLLLVAGACGSDARSDPNPAPTARPSTIPRPGATQIKGEPPTLLRSSPAAGVFTLPYSGAWRYDGPKGTLDPAGIRPQPLEHPAPSGPLAAVERQSPTPGGYYVSTELAVRDGPSGAERVIYRAPQLFYWSGWSPDGHYIALWAVDFFSGSIDLDGRPLVLLDARTGARVDLGRTLLNATTAWTPPHTLAFVAGGGRMVWDAKTLRVWSPETGVHDVTASGVVGFAPVWSADGRSLYFVSGAAGQYDPVSFFTGRDIGDRTITIYDPATGTQRRLAHETGFVEEGVRPSRDGSRLLVLRRSVVDAKDPRSIPDAPVEVWLTNADGKQGTPLLRVARVGFGYYGWYPGPSEWDWSE
jgi:dipeptidyl aminopeptidase/acylaminoacyl peptidase